MRSIREALSRARRQGGDPSPAGAPVTPAPPTPDLTAPAAHHGAGPRRTSPVMSRTGGPGGTADGSTGSMGGPPHHPWAADDGLRSSTLIHPDAIVLRLGGSLDAVEPDSIAPVQAAIDRRALHDLPGVQIVAASAAAAEAAAAVLRQATPHAPAP